MHHEQWGLPLASHAVAAEDVVGPGIDYLSRLSEHVLRNVRLQRGRGRVAAQPRVHGHGKRHAALGVGP